MVRRHHLTIFLDVRENTNVLEVKNMISGITKRPLEEMKLFYEGQQLDDTKTIAEVGISNATARAQTPATIGLCFAGRICCRQAVLSPICQNLLIFFLLNR